MPGEADEIDEFAQDGKFELQLQAVHGSLQRDLDRVLTGVLETQEREVHDDDQDVDPHELLHNLPVLLFLLRGGLQNFDRMDNVQPRDDAFLDGESGHLNLLHDVVAIDKLGCRMVDIGSIGQDGRGDVQEENVSQDHIEHTAKLPLVSEDEMESRV